MKKSHKSLLYISIAIAVLLAFVLFLSQDKPVSVVIKQAETGQVMATVANTRAGTVKACQRAQLSPPIGGQISRLPVKEGDLVKKDEILLELWNDNLLAEHELSKREARATQARAEEACVTADVARHEADRLVKLHKQKLASEELMDRAVGEANARRAGCNAARATSRVSEARIDVTAAHLERTRLRAPFDGIVAEINGEVGEFVTPSPVGVPTLPTIDIIDNSCIYILAPIDEVDAPNIKKDLPAYVSLDAFPDRKFKGRIRRIAAYVLDIEKQARTVDIEVEISETNELPAFLAGYSADIEIILDTRNNVLRIPTEAVLEGHEVYIYDDGVLRKRKIKSGLSNWQFTEILAGVEKGEWVVTSVEREGVADGVNAKAENQDHD